MLLLRFLLAWLAFTFGPGAAATLWLTRDTDIAGRVIVALAVGSALVPLIVVALGLAHALAVFPYLAGVLALAGLAGLYRTSPAHAPRPLRADLVGYALVVALAGATGAIAFAHRLDVSLSGIQVYGVYDSMDLSYYAVMASEATHTVPPTASFYSGHMLNAAYYPQLVLAMVGRFADVPLLTIYFRYAWPAFLCLGALTAYVFVRAVAPPAVATLSVVLMLVASDFSYLAAWLLPHATHEWDYMLWSTNFLSPTMEVLHFNTWTPTLPVFFGALYGAVRALQTRSWGWTALTGVVLAVLFQFKPFAYMVLIGGFAAAAIFARDGDARRRLGATAGLGVLLALPFAYAIAMQPDRRSRFLIDLVMLPQRMLIKLDLVDAFDAFAGRVMPLAPLRRPLLLLLATVLFFAGGLGIRWLGLPGVWRAIRGRAPDQAAAWSVIGWCTAAGLLVPFVLVTDPYVDTLQFYQSGLYLLWIFTAAALLTVRWRSGMTAALAIAAAIAVSLPTSIHFLQFKWTESRREPRVAISRGEAAIAASLRERDPDRTVILHDQPESPSLIAILAEQRVVLAWGHPYYAVGSAGRLRDVNMFFSSADGDPAAAVDTLRRYKVTHVIVADRDRVHPAVLARLTPITQYKGVTLYEVPPEL